MEDVVPIHYPGGGTMHQGMLFKIWVGGVPGVNDETCTGGHTAGYGGILFADCENC
jgi:hypothetical protein